MRKLKRIVHLKRQLILNQVSGCFEKESVSEGINSIFYIFRPFLLAHLHQVFFVLSFFGKPLKYLSAMIYTTILEAKL